MSQLEQPAAKAAGAGALYRTLWRWHFYAGLYVIPFVIVLALSGMVFLFKPQIERWEERAFQAAAHTGTAALSGSTTTAAAGATPSQQVAAALAAHPDASFHSYRLPVAAGDAALVHLALSGTGAMRDVFVSPQGDVVGGLDAGTRIVEVARRIHSQLLLGQRASWLVELAACWAIVMVITGLYLWWPRGRGAAGVVWPRRAHLLRDLHAVTGFWVAGLALVLLLTGLPWTDVWGNAFRMVRTELGWVQGTPQWSTEGGAGAVPAAHASHGHGAMDAGHPDHSDHAAHYELAHLDQVVARGALESPAFPTLALAPGAALFGPPSPDWTLTSLVQDRPHGITLTFDAQTGELLTHERFADRHVIDRVIGYGQAWHEGALFGALNQLIGVLTALALVTMSVTGFLMWRRRRPAGVLGAPALPAQRRKPLFVAVVIVVLAALLPLLAASLLLLWLIDLVLPRISPAAAAWLGVVSGPRHRAGT